MEDSDAIPGQMDVDECIEVASTGSDGKPPTKTPVQHTDRPLPGGRISIKDLVKGKLKHFDA